MSIKAGLLVALLIPAFLMVGGCSQEEEADAPEESSEGTTEETTAGPTRVERTIIKETTVVVPAPAAAPSPEQASSPTPEAQPADSPETGAPEVDIPHDGTVVPCYQDPVCSSEQARIQSEWTQGHRTTDEQVQEELARMQQEAQEAQQKIEQEARKVQQQVERVVGP